MKEKFLGIDLHTHYAAIMVRDTEGSEIQYIARCTDFQEYIDSLSDRDAVALESTSKEQPVSSLIRISFSSLWVHGARRKNGTHP